MDESSSSEFLICVQNEDHPVSLELRKVYRMIPDPVADARHFVRVIDESGEDYLYPQDCFVPIELPPAAEKAFAQPS